MENGREIARVLGRTNRSTTRTRRSTAVLWISVKMEIHRVSATGAGPVFLHHCGFHCATSLKSTDEILGLRSIALTVPGFSSTLDSWGLEKAVVPRFSYSLVRRTGAPDRRACGAGRMYTCSVVSTFPAHASVQSATPNQKRSATTYDSEFSTPCVTPSTHISIMLIF